jgi:hypothetical protein
MIDKENPVILRELLREGQGRRGDTPIESRQGQADEVEFIIFRQVSCRVGLTKIDCWFRVYDSLAYGVGQIYKIYLQQSFLRIKMAFKIRTKNPARVDELVVRSMVEDPEAEASLVEVLADTAEDIIGDGPEGSQFLGIFIGNLDTKFFFDRHEGLEEVEGIEPEVVI